MQTQCPNAIPCHGRQIALKDQCLRLSNGRFQLPTRVLPSTVAAVEVFSLDQSESPVAPLREAPLPSPGSPDDPSAARPDGRVGIGVRFSALVVSLGCLLVLLIASQLTPSPAGYGSHTGYPLRLQSCAFMERTGLPCPSCGMTTSFCWFVRGNVAASVYVQPMGALLAAMACCCVWGGLYVAATGRPIYRLLGMVPGRYYTLPLLTIAVLAWGWKIIIHVKGLDGWR
jgi:hypothetical protein